MAEPERIQEPEDKHPEFHLVEKHPEKSPAGGFAVSSIVAGIIGALFPVVIIFEFIAVVFGLIALLQVHSAPQKQKNLIIVLASVGTLLGMIGLFLFVLVYVVPEF